MATHIVVGWADLCRQAQAPGSPVGRGQDPQPQPRSPFRQVLSGLQPHTPNTSDGALTSSWILCLTLNLAGLKDLEPAFLGWLWRAWRGGSLGLGSGA